MPSSPPQKKPEYPFAIINIPAHILHHLAWYLILIQAHGPLIRPFGTPSDGPLGIRGPLYQKRAICCKVALPANFLLSFLLYTLRCIVYSGSFCSFADLKYIKGTVSRDFLHPIFFINQFILIPLEMSMGHFDFFAFWLSYRHFKMIPRCLGHRGVAPKSFS